MDTMQSDLDDIILARQTVLGLTSTDRANQNLAQLHEILLQAQKAEEDAPQATEQAEENYLRAKHGSRYTDIQYERYEYQGAQLANDRRREHNKQLQDLDDKLETYASTITYVNNLEEVKQTITDKIQGLVKSQGSTSNLDNRSTYYTEVSLLSLSRVILFENIFLISYVLVMMLDFNRVSHRELLIILTILFFTDLFLTLLHKLPNSILYYTEWGYDPVESKTNWIMVVSILLCLALLLTYIQTINEFFNSS